MGEISGEIVSTLKRFLLIKNKHGCGRKRPCQEWDFGLKLWDPPAAWSFRSLSGKVRLPPPTSWGYSGNNVKVRCVRALSTGLALGGPQTGLRNPRETVSPPRATPDCEAPLPSLLTRHHRGQTSQEGSSVPKSLLQARTASPEEPPKAEESHRQGPHQT